MNSILEHIIARHQNKPNIGSAAMAINMAELLNAIVEQYDWKTLNELEALVTKFGEKMISTTRSELIIRSVVKRVIKIIREEAFEHYISKLRENPPEEESTSSPDLSNANELNNTLSAMQDSSMFSLMARASSKLDWKANMDDRHGKKLKPLISQDIYEIIDEIETSCHNIAEQSPDHIHDGDMILTVGDSHTLVEFFARAYKTRKFKVIISEAAPHYSGHQMAKKLTKLNIPVQIIHESGIAATMGTVSKVIIGCHIIMADGGLVAIAGSQLMAMTASRFSVPVIVVSGFYKLVDKFSYSRNELLGLLSPSTIVQYDSLLTGASQIYCPYYDYVDSKFVSLFITNFGGHPPSYLYRLLGEIYGSSDIY